MQISAKDSEEMQILGKDSGKMAQISAKNHEKKPSNFGNRS